MSLFIIVLVWRLTRRVICLISNIMISSFVFIILVVLMLLLMSCFAIVVTHYSFLLNDLMSLVVRSMSNDSKSFSLLWRYLSSLSRFEH